MYSGYGNNYMNPCMLKFMKLNIHEKVHLIALILKLKNSKVCFD